VNGITNDAYAEAGWSTFAGKVLQKLEDGKYLVKDTSQDPPVTVILNNVPLDLVDDEALTPVRCKDIGSEAYTAVNNAKTTRRVYDFGVPCSPPKGVIDSLKLQKEFLLQQYSQANERRFRIELQEAEQGSASAQFMLGRRYLYGDGVAEDEEQARRWLEKAAAQGELDAQATLLILGFQK
jgi:TPR repeat protein